MAKFNTLQELTLQELIDGMIWFNDVNRTREIFTRLAAGVGGGPGAQYTLSELLDKEFSLLEDGTPVSTINLLSFPTFTDLYTGNAVIRGGVIYDSILDQYYIWATAYIIDGIFYNTPIDGYVTLPDGDATFDRIVVFKIVNDGTNPASVGFDLGPADGTLLEPSLDLSQEVEVGFKILIANETVPTEITDILIYDENVGSPTEWNITTAPAGGNPADTTLPYNGAVSHFIPASNVSLGLTGTSTVTIVANTKLVFALKTSTIWSPQSRLRITIEDTGSGETSNILSLNRNNASNYNFVHTNTGVWQIVSIDISEFQNFNATTLDKVTFAFVALNSMQVDRKFIQNGIQSTNNPPLIDKPPIENYNTPYTDTAALFNAQSSQTPGYGQFVTDASGFTGVTNGKAIAFYLGTVNGDETDYEVYPQSGGGATSLTLDVNQVAHGLSVGEAIKFDGVDYILAQADVPANSDTIGVVIDVADVDNFTFQYVGLITVGSWVDGTHYFLSPSVAGAIIAEPTYAIGEVRQYIGQGIPEGLLLNISLGDEIESGDDLLEEDATVTGAKNVDWTYHTFLYTMTGNTVFSESNLPLSGTNTKVITIHMDGNFTPTFPAGWDTYLTGAYIGTKLNTIVVEFVKTGFYKMQITQDN